MVYARLTLACYWIPHIKWDLPNPPLMIILVKVAFNTNIVITSARDIINLVQDHTTVELLSHTKEDKTAISDTLPTLGSLTGALKIHCLFFTNTGSVSAKDLPTDLSARPINIKVMRPPPGRS